MTGRTESRAGKIAVSGRYHRPPKELTTDYAPEQKVLGSGYNGQVNLAKRKGGGNEQRVAVKAFKLHGVNREKKDELESECEIFLSMDHPHVARLLDVYETSEYLYLVMECLEGGELFHRVTERRKFSEKDAAEAAFQMLLAVNYIHTHGIVHRDIKLENFLYEKKDNNHLKLIDFGFSKIWDPNTKMALSCGTLAYVAPEVLEKSYTSKCDLWSLGVVIFILLVGYMPFAGSESHQVEMIKAGKCTYRKDSWAKVSKEASDFVAKMLIVDPKKRLSAEDALKDQWIQKRKDLPSPEQVPQDIMDSLASFAQASIFRRACMSVMAWSLTSDERAQVREAFLALDKGNTGTIKLGEFKQIMQDRFHVEDKQIMESFKALDISHTEEIHYSDFLAAMVSSRIQVHDELLVQTFKRFDTDNTGFITVTNLKEVLGETFEGEQIEQLIKEVPHEDGKISYQEFIYYLKHPESAEHHQEAAHKIIETQLKRPENENSSKSVGPERLRQKTGVNGETQEGTAPSGGGAAASPEQQKKGGCCTLL